MTPIWRRLAPWLPFAVFAVAYFPRFAKPAGIPLYVEAANCLWTEQVLQVCSLKFTYPPFFAFVMMPFVALPAMSQTIVWWTVSLYCTVLCCFLAERIAKNTFGATWTERETALLRIGGIFLSLKFILAVYENQGYDLFAFVPLLLGVFALSTKQDAKAGIYLAAAAALKVTPVIFLPYLVFKGRIRAATAFCAALAFFSFLPDVFFTPLGAPHGYFVTWIREVAAAGLFEHTGQARLAFWDGPNIYNLSLRGALARAVEGTALQSDFLALLRATQLAFIAVVGAVLLPSRKSESSIPLEASILVIAALALSPMTSRTHFVVLILPYFLLAAAILKDTHHRSVYLATGIASFIGCTGIPRDLVPHAVTEFAARHNDILIGTLILIVPISAMLTSKSRQSPAQRPVSPLNPERRVLPNE